MQAWKTIVSVGATPALQALLNFAGLLTLTPFAHWGWDSSFIQPITYVTTTATSAISLLVTPKSNKRRAWVIGLGIFALVGFFGLYNWLSDTPPSVGYLVIYDLASYSSFFMTYVAFGFLVAQVIGYFTQQKRK